MIIEIRKVGFVNKGAELMLLSVLDRLGMAFPDARFTMVPTARDKDTPQPVERIMRAGLYPKISVFRMGHELSDIARLVPERLRSRYGLIMDHEVNAVVDAAGFAYSDQWGPSSARELAYFAKRWRKQGAKIVLMPQAFGPFEGHEIREYMRRAIDNCDLVFAREKTSYEHLTSVVGKRHNIKIAPDFTNLLAGVVPEEFDAGECRVALVPNYRMIDKTDPSSSTAYLPFMIQCAKDLLDRAQKPFVLVHEGAPDSLLAQQISREVGGIPIISESDPRAIKGILGSCYATIGSRFHGLVSALSQGVPSLATGWSHKYKELFVDYGFGEGVLDPAEGWDSAARRIGEVVEPARNAALRVSLGQRAKKIKAEAEDMWSLVIKTLEG